jgi:hypothetical protein
MGDARFLWGGTKVDFVSFKPRAVDPPIKVGRMYFNTTQGFKFCTDSTTWGLIRDVLHN